jgi:hypothetical protein
MSVLYTRQYRGLSDLEYDSTGFGFPVSVRLRELAWSINNYKAHYAPCYIIPCQRFWNNHLISVESSSDEEVIHIFAPVFIPHGYRRFVFTIGGYVNTSDSCRFRLYSSGQKYTGPQTFDQDYIGSGIGYAEAWISSTSHQFRHGPDGNIAKDSKSGLSWFTLTAQNTTASGGYYCFVKSISACAYLS